MRAAVPAFIVGVAAAEAEAWEPLAGAGIDAALSGRTLEFETAWQRPPNAAWTCYEVDIDREAGEIRFRGQGGDITVGRYREE